MASRRKSAKPTNKLRHQLHVDEDEEDEAGESRISGVSMVHTITSHISSQLNVTPQMHQQNQRPPCSDMSDSDTSRKQAQYLTPSEISEPHIALPSDILQDFEALKSATRLDSTELMRKLLKDYQKITASNQLSRERKLDDVIHDLFASRSSNILDLSKPKGAYPSPNGHDQESNSLPGIFPRYTDDQLAMGILDGVHEKDGGTDLRPLDLTLHKNDRSISLDSPTAVDVCLKRKLTTHGPSPPFKYFAASNGETQSSHSFRHAGSYVINLEPSNEGPSFANSSLAQVLQMDIPLHSFNKGQKHGTVIQDSLLFKEERTTPFTLRKMSPETSAQRCQGNVSIRSKLFHEEKEPLAVNTVSDREIISTGSSMSGLPSYAEAVTSVLNSQQSKRTHEIKPTTENQSVDKTAQDSQSGALSFMHINTDDKNIKFIPLNLNSQVVATTSSSQDHPKQQQNLLQHLLQHQLKSDNKPLQHQLHNTTVSQPNPHANSLSTLCNGQVSHLQIMQVPGMTSDLTDTAIPHIVRGGDVSYPNFLLESHSVGIPSISSALTGVTMPSSTHSSTSMSIPTFFMTTSSQGGMGHMVAIPVIHALPDGVTGLQPFAFAPHPITQSSNTSTVGMYGSSDILFTSSSSVPTNLSSSLRQSEEPLNHESSVSTLSTPESKSSLPTEAVKPKPGRPRGRGGRGQSQKVQNKDMKLLTENTLFPGVYTSILKLPWSRRSRNKTKIKTTSEIKKQAQIIAHCRVNENGDNFIKDEIIKTEETDQEKSNKESHFDEISSQNTVEKRQEFQQLQQEQGDHEQRHQMQQQKLKDLEQQQRLHLQYHLRLQEEQEKLTKQIEQSCLNINTDPPVHTPLSISSQQLLLGEPVGSNAMSESMQFGQSLFSKDPVMMVYSNQDVSSPKKTPRKRGRPPKIPNVTSSTAEGHLTLTTTSMTGTLEQNEPDNFLHSNVTAENFMTSTADIKPHANISVFPRHLSASGSDEYVSMAASKSQDIGVNGDNEMTLEKKITFLTNQIGLELSKTNVTYSPGVVKQNSSQPNKCGEQSGSLEDTMYQEMKMAVNKSLIDIKPRRKKVSRLLKSDENFMYATFKIKPKGLTPRKSRRRRKDVLASTAAVAESIANLRQKGIHDCTAPCSKADSSKLPSMVAWKFHEQYPCLNDEEEGKDRRMVCVKCGNYFNYESENAAFQQCEACLLNSTDISSGIGTNEIHVNVGKVKIEDTEMKAECCVTCGNIFQKHYSDPSVRCEVCRNNTPGVIKSSKLFSFHDDPTDQILVDPPGPKSSTTPVFFATSENYLKSETCSSESFTKINNNHLFCSLCRMEFTKICDYLAHIKDTHEALDINTQLLTASNDLSRKPRVSKTKKSLAHKTLTCPVEECPHFFREQKDLDLHLTKKHSNFGTSVRGDIFTTSDDIDDNVQFQNSLSVSSAAASADNGAGKGDEEILNNSDKIGPTVNTCEKPLQCEFCDYRCRQKNALAWHMRKHPEGASQYRRYSNINVD